MGSNRSKRIPDPLEAAVAEVLFVDGGEVGDALLDEEERGPPIVGTAAGEVGFAEGFCEEVGQRDEWWFHFHGDEVDPIFVQRVERVFT